MTNREVSRNGRLPARRDPASTRPSPSSVLLSEERRSVLNDYASAGLSRTTGHSLELASWRVVPGKPASSDADSAASSRGGQFDRAPRRGNASGSFQQLPLLSGRELVQNAVVGVPLRGRAPDVADD